MVDVAEAHRTATCGDGQVGFDGVRPPPCRGVLQAGLGWVGSGVHDPFCYKKKKRSEP